MVPPEAPLAATSGPLHAYIGAMTMKTRVKPLFGAGSTSRPGTGRKPKLSGHPAAGSPASPPGGTAPGAASWGYGPLDGPARWATLDPAFAACDLGREQSPIDLTGGRRVDLTPVEFDYPRTRFAVENTGRTIQVNPDPGSGIVLDGVRYALQQFHFHHGSEHTVDGARLPLEMHLVHRSDQGTLAVVGVLFRVGAANAGLAPVWACLPAAPGGTAVPSGRLDLSALLPAGRTTWRYRGSLTTPPCTEGVAWVVLAEPLTLSAAQIDAFAALYPNNRRPVQPLGERVLQRG